MTLSARHVDADAHIIVNGRRMDGTIDLLEEEIIRVELAEGHRRHELTAFTNSRRIDQQRFHFLCHRRSSAKRALTLGEMFKIMAGKFARRLG